MTITFPFLEKPIELSENRISTLIIENPVLLRQTVCKLKGQDSDIIVWDGYTRLDMHKVVEFIVDIFELDFSSKGLASKIFAEVSNTASDYILESNSLIARINELGNKIAAEMDFPITFAYLEDIERVLKVMGFSVATEDMDMPERILTYMNVSRKLLKRKVFIFLNLKSFLSENELSEFYKNVAYEKFCVLLLESYQRSYSDTNKETVIIDRDFCII